MWSQDASLCLWVSSASQESTSNKVIDCQRLKRSTGGALCLVSLVRLRLDSTRRDSVNLRISLSSLEVLRPAPTDSTADSSVTLKIDYVKEQGGQRGLKHLTPHGNLSPTHSPLTDRVVPLQLLKRDSRCFTSAAFQTDDVNVKCFHGEIKSAVPAASVLSVRD